MRYSEATYYSGMRDIRNQTNQEEQNAGWNYYQQFGGTGVETPGLKLAMYSIGRRKRKAEDNLAAYYQVLKGQEDQQDKWEKIWADQRQKELDEADDFDWLGALGSVVGTASKVLPFLP